MGGDVSTWVTIVGLLATWVVGLVALAVRVEARLGKIERDRSDAMADQSMKFQTLMANLRAAADAKIAGCERRCAELAEKLAEHKLQMIERLGQYPTKDDLRDAVDSIVDRFGPQMQRMENMLTRATRP